MDFLNKSLAQVSELFRSMTPGARITAGLLLAVVVVSLGYLFQYGAAGPDAFLFGGQAYSDAELNRMQAALATANISSTRENNRLSVPTGQQAAAVAAIAEADALPRDFNNILEDALGKVSPFDSSVVTRERLRNAKQQELTELIRAMPWVEEAKVLYDEQPSRGLSGKKVVTGSVSVRPAVGETLDIRRAKTLQKLVAGSIPGLLPENVAITDLNEGGLSGGSEMFPELIEDEYLRNKVVFEMQKKESILNALRDIPGVRVEVNADFDNKFEEKSTTLKPDKTQSAPRRTVTSNESDKQTVADGGGQPGVTAQGPGRQNTTQAAQRQNESTKTNETEETENVVAVERSDALNRGYTLKDVWATVTIPSRYVEDLWRERNKEATAAPKPEDLQFIEGQVKTDVQDVVEPLLRLQLTKGEDSYKRTTVVFLDTLPTPPIEPPSPASQAMAWAGRYWSTVAMLGVAMFSLLVMRSVVKSGPASAGVAPGSSTGLTLQVEEPSPRSQAGPDEPTDDRPRLRLKKGTTLKDDLVQIVQDDPDAAVEILRSWIGKAS